MTNHIFDNIDPIIFFQIFDRKGDRIFENFDFKTNLPSVGSGGFYEDKVMDPVVFVYKAELHSVFGETISIDVDITLTRQTPSLLYSHLERTTVSF